MAKDTYEYNKADSKLTVTAELHPGDLANWRVDLWYDVNGDGKLEQGEARVLATETAQRSISLEIPASSLMDANGNAVLAAVSVYAQILVKKKKKLEVKLNSSAQASTQKSYSHTGTIQAGYWHVKSVYLKAV